MLPDEIPNSAIEYFFHIRILMAMFVSLSMSRIAIEAAKFIQFQDDHKPSRLQISWIITFSIFIINWWWDIIDDAEFTNISFAYYIASILYAFGFYFLTALITPQGDSYDGNFDTYFMRIKKWFYALFILNGFNSALIDCTLGNVDSDTYIELSICVISAGIFIYFSRRENIRIHYHISLAILTLQILLLFLMILI